MAALNPPVQLFDANGIAISSSNPLSVQSGGGSYTALASAATAAAIKSGAGRCYKVIVTATGTGTATVYDSLAASGTVILAIPASAAVGTIYEIDVPFQTGLSAISAASGPALIITWN